jgi:hypothetical protein
LDDSVLISLIRQAVVEGKYMVSKHTFQKHGLEGFRYANVKDAILNGRIIERRDREARVVISGTSDSIAHRSEFLGSFIHCVVQWDDVNMMVIVTAYRPNIHDWTSDSDRIQKST